MVAGLAVNVLGHAHPAVLAAIQKQASRLVHVSNLVHSEPQLDVAEKLVATAFPSRVFFCNSGAEAVEGAIKIARKWGVLHAATPARSSAPAVPSTAGPWERSPRPPTATTATPSSRCPGASSMSRTTISRRSRRPSTAHRGGADGAHRGPVRGRADERRDPPRLRAGSATAQPPAHPRRGADRHGPDRPVVGPSARGHRPRRHGRGQGSGRRPPHRRGPRRAARRRPGPGDHGTTFGGGPLVTAVAAVVIDAIENEGLVDNAARVGEHLRGGSWDSARPGRAHRPVRGRGLMLGVLLTEPIAPLLVPGRPRRRSPRQRHRRLGSSAWSARSTLTKAQADEAETRRAPSRRSPPAEVQGGPGGGGMRVRPAPGAASLAARWPRRSASRPSSTWSRRGSSAPRRRSSRRYASAAWEVTQATVSRDIRELGLARVHETGGPRYVAGGRARRPRR